MAPRRVNGCCVMRPILGSARAGSFTRRWPAAGPRPWQGDGHDDAFSGAPGRPALPAAPRRRPALAAPPPTPAASRPRRRSRRSRPRPPGPARPSASRPSTPPSTAPRAGQLVADLSTPDDAAGLGGRRDRPAHPARRAAAQRVRLRRRAAAPSTCSATTTSRQAQRGARPDRLPLRLRGAVQHRRARAGSTSTTTARSAAATTPTASATSRASTAWSCSAASRSTRARSARSRQFRWADMPGNLIPTDFYSPEEQAALRLSSKSHWDVPVRIGRRTVHFLVSHPTPPTFDGPEDRNGRRNHDEIRFWADYVAGGRRALRLRRPRPPRRPRPRRVVRDRRRPERRPARRRLGRGRRRPAARPPAHHRPAARPRPAAPRPPRARAAPTSPTAATRATTPPTSTTTPRRATCAPTTSCRRAA